SRSARCRRPSVSGPRASRPGPGSAGAATTSRGWPGAGPRNRPPGGGRGRGYDQSRLAERRHPNRLDWDVVAPDHPVIFTRTCGHIASVNGRALEQAGITEATPDPPGGRYDREGGRNLGVAYETAQTPLQVAAMPSADEFRDALLRADTAYIAAGGTSVHDAGGVVGPAFGPAQALADAGRLRIRIYAFATVNSRQHPLMGLLGTGARTGRGNGRLARGGFKVMTDGSSSGPTAATREPYTSDCQDCGILYWSQGDPDRLLGRGHRQGFQCTVHAVGDRAIEQTLNAMGRAQRELPRQGLRHRIEHRGSAPPHPPPPAPSPPPPPPGGAEQGTLPIMQPAFFWEFGDGYIANYGQS